MALKIKKMKGIDVSCVSPSSTAICSSIRMDQHEMIKTSTKSLNRLNSYLQLGDHYKTLTNNNNNNNNSRRSRGRAPCISELPFTPRPSSFSAYRDKLPSNSHLFPTRKSSADATDHIKHYCTRNYTRFHNENDTKAKKNEKSTPTPAAAAVFGSEARRSTSRVETRRLGSMLEDEKEKIRKHFSLIHVSEAAHVHGHGMKETASASASACNNQSPNKNTSFPNSRHQVVVLRVSLHCRGCENKLRRHLSKMEGVASYNIDMETKKVTVVGNVTPLEVLTNISKVKNAQLWPSQGSSSSTSSSSSSSTTTTYSL